MSADSAAAASRLPIERVLRIFVSWRPCGAALAAAGIALAAGCGQAPAGGQADPWLLAASNPPAPRTAAAATAAEVDFGAVSPSAAARRLAGWAVATRDHDGRPFAVIDKPAARLYVFDGRGRLAGHAPVLLGLATGDDTVPGIGDRPLAQVRPHERTTPAGRFVTAPGRNADGARVVWIDYDAAVSMHAVIPGDRGERRHERLESPDPARRRISYGCVNVPVPFFEQTVLPAFANKGGIVYVLPDRRPPEAVFPGLAATRLQ